MTSFVRARNSSTGVRNWINFLGNYSVRSSKHLEKDILVTYKGVMVSFFFFSLHTPLGEAETHHQWHILGSLGVSCLSTSDILAQATQPGPECPRIKPQFLSEWLKVHRSPCNHANCQQSPQKQQWVLFYFSVQPHSQIHIKTQQNLLRDLFGMWTQQAHYQCCLIQSCTGQCLSH